MSFEIIPTDDDGKKKVADETRIGPGQPKNKAENPWKGRFNRRKTARQVNVDFPDPDNDPSKGKPDSED